MLIMIVMTPVLSQASTITSVARPSENPITMTTMKKARGKISSAKRRTTSGVMTITSRRNPE